MFTPGQVILYKNGPNTISKLVRLIEGNKITHCSVVLIGDELDPYCLEIENAASKVRLVKLSQTYNYTDEIYIATNKNLKIPPQLPNSAWIISQLTNKKYSVKALLNSMINHFLGLFNSSYKYKEYFKVKDKYTCASLVSEVLMLISNYNCDAPSLAEPDDFTTVPWILTRYK